MPRKSKEPIIVELDEIEFKFRSPGMTDLYPLYRAMGLTDLSDPDAVGRIMTLHQDRILTDLVPALSISPKIGGEDAEYQIDEFDIAEQVAIINAIFDDIRRGSEMAETFPEDVDGT